MIVLYHADFDGVASAALLLKWARLHGFPNEDSALMPVDFVLKQQWARTDDLHRAVAIGQLLDEARPYHEPIAVVDFLYHPSADIWVDHHPTPFACNAHREHWLMRVAEHETNPRYPDPCFRYLEPGKPSAATVVARHFGVNDMDSQALVADADIIDAAQYPSAEAYFEDDLPGSVIDRGLQGAGIGIWNEAVRQLASRPLVDVAEDTRFSVPAAAVKASRKADRDRYADHMDFQNGIVATNLLRTGVGFSRYAPFWHHSDALYHVTLSEQGAVIKLQASHNPWIPYDEGDANLGQLMADIASPYGGGHTYVASAIFPPDKVGEAVTAFHKLVKALRG